MQHLSDSLTELSTLLPLVTAQGQDIRTAMATGAPAARKAHARTATDPAHTVAGRAGFAALAHELAGRFTVVTHAATFSAVL
ncbi:hypothetical protein ACFVRD_35300 [Streptomyces sp. NPDC057908]|uniref:hypothetical protein n=1 Tax=Streptomyces sp. NPDC057908 TaxID=3346276 RepID=UPI0036E58F8E